MMLLSPYVMSIFSAVCNKNSKLLKQMYSTDGEHFVSGAYQLYVNHLITTYYGNFIEGGDDVEPLDMVCPEELHPTSKGISLWQRLELNTNRL